MSDAARNKLRFFLAYTQTKQKPPHRKKKYKENFSVKYDIITAKEKQAMVINEQAFGVSQTGSATVRACEYGRPETAEEKPNNREGGDERKYDSFLQ